MRKLALAFLLTLPFAFSTSASALPLHAQSAYLSDFVVNPDLIEVKGGRGGGHGGGWGRGRSSGWAASRGRKVGWRGAGCPPGLRMQGRC